MRRPRDFSIHDQPGDVPRVVLRARLRDLKAREEALGLRPVRQDRLIFLRNLVNRL
jgi:hypothetical protein